MVGRGEPQIADSTFGQQLCVVHRFPAQVDDRGDSQRGQVRKVSRVKSPGDSHEVRHPSEVWSGPSKRKRISQAANENASVEQVLTSSDSRLLRGLWLTGRPGPAIVGLGVATSAVRPQCVGWTSEIFIMPRAPSQPRVLGYGCTTRAGTNVEWRQGELFPRVGFTSFRPVGASPEGVAHFYSGRGWIEEGEYAVNCPACREAAIGSWPTRCGWLFSSLSTCSE